MRVNNWLSGFACVLLLGVVGCKKDKIREGIPVVVEKVGVDDVEIFGDYVGRIRARQFVEVHARVEGYLEKMLFEEGKRVERNQPLFIINPDLYKARAEKRRSPGVENRTRCRAFASFIRTECSQPVGPG